MPILFALVPEPAPVAAAGSPLRPALERQRRMFRASVLASVLALAVYGLCAAAWPLIAPAFEPKVVVIDYGPPHDPLPPPRIPDQAPPVAHPAPPVPAPPEPAPVDQGDGKVVPTPEAVPEAPAASGGEPGTAGGREDAIPGQAATPDPSTGERAIVDYWEEAPQVVHEVKPEYPQIARDAGVSGMVVLKVLVGLDGQIEDVQVLKSVPLLDPAAIEAARRWVFRPARVSGRPVRVWVSLPMRFRLH